MRRKLNYYGLNERFSPGQLHLSIITVHMRNIEPETANRHSKFTTRS